MPAEAIQADRQSPRFLWLYALAWAGGAIGYVPFLTILLPLRITAVTGTDNIRWLALITFSGAIAASVGNILFGWLSDRSGSRRGWIASGLALNVGLLLAMTLVVAPLALLGLILLWQLALNMMLGPLSAWAGDCVPRVQMGLLGGLLAFAPAMGALAGVLITVPNFAWRHLSSSTVHDRSIAIDWPSCRCHVVSCRRSASGWVQALSSAGHWSSVPAGSRAASDLPIIASAG